MNPPNTIERCLIRLDIGALSPSKKTVVTLPENGQFRVNLLDFTIYGTSMSFGLK
ncbi:hypothetical protein PghCCS26_17590 [Paenibacillus glycanilyticus]|uniref:Uncharacterized protein n=1 Tax=Paenibacillus glycanilyticus TaxID=126569 RepID=A0ABQ6NHR5_9BACL|nr:hypothetical protein PghCCS26_17590 [Paenibacillus glycanilyticus]